MSNGKIIANTPLAVDFWHVRRCPESRLFFLTHMHSDHTVGLTSTWADRPIYCSPVTASLLKMKLQVKEKWIHSLEVGESHLLPLDDIGKEHMTVTLINANHCPGAVMFLFQGYFGTILYTGDFRYSSSLLREVCLATNANIDVLYLDNTNCDPNRIIPSRQEATQQIKQIIRSHPDHNVVLGLYALGKESLLVELAMEFQTWIEVSMDRMETLRLLKLPDVFTTDFDAGRIRVVEQREITFSALCHWNSKKPTLAIYPTSRPTRLFHSKFHVVPYSDHSSYHELVDFVSGLKPFSLVPIVGNSIPESLSTLLPCKRHQVIVPQSVQQYMSRLPENCHKSSAYLPRQHDRPLVPKGVIFDSPGSSTKRPRNSLCQDFSSEEGIETDSVDCVMPKSSKILTSRKTCHQNSLNSCRRNFVRTIPEEMLTTHSLPFSQLRESNFAPMEILKFRNVHLTPRQRTTKEAAGSLAKRISACSMSNDTDSSVSESDSIILCSLNCDSPTLSDLLGVSEAELNQVENDVFNHLVIPEQDLEPLCLLNEDALRMVRLCPVPKRHLL
nr:5' exonuclease Apollo-like [Nerophis lumbriciformis]